ncbi:MAG: DUF971 domain-containing protein [Myxococcaceae bacterium]
MSFWDTLKPTPRPHHAVDAALSEDGKALALTWDDGLKSTVSAVVLRQNCPCAECVDEWSGKRTLDVTKVPADMTASQLTPVGNYAVSMVFKDQHRTGIFNWEHLRKLSGAQP